MTSLIKILEKESKGESYSIIEAIEKAACLALKRTLENRLKEAYDDERYWEHLVSVVPVENSRKCFCYGDKVPPLEEYPPFVVKTGEDVLAVRINLGMRWTGVYVYIVRIEGELPLEKPQIANGAYIGFAFLRPSLDTISGVLPYVVPGGKIYCSIFEKPENEAIIWNFLTKYIGLVIDPSKEEDRKKKVETIPFLIKNPIQAEWTMPYLIK